ncbi:MAG: UPF0149 family protein [Gammaproteobacteria bacterium]|nr:UPF0149 family protein [Gammaproteobacteria bacterium]
MQYHELEKSLLDSGIPLKIEECHAVACACVCIEPARSDYNTVSQYLEQVHDWTINLERMSFVLAALGPDICEQLRSESIEFKLLLPDDDSIDLGKRVQALASWCGGFLIGLSVQTPHYRFNDTALSEDSRAFLADISRIVELSVDDESGRIGQSAEADLFELTEYCRVGVVGIFLDLDKARLQAGAPNPPNTPAPASIH